VSASAFVLVDAVLPVGNHTISEYLPRISLTPGTDHPRTLTARNNLASAYQAAGRPAEAIEPAPSGRCACRARLPRDSAGPPGAAT